MSQYWVHFSTENESPAEKLKFGCGNSRLIIKRREEKGQRIYNDDDEIHVFGVEKAKHKKKSNDSH